MKISNTVMCSKTVNLDADALTAVAGAIKRTQLNVTVATCVSRFAITDVVNTNTISSAMHRITLWDAIDTDVRSNARVAAIFGARMNLIRGIEASRSILYGMQINHNQF